VLEEPLRGVPGWLTDEEAWALYEAARRSSPGQPVLTGVELGSWLGRSTIALAAGLRARDGGGALFAVDPHRGTALHRAEGVLDTFDAFNSNVRSAGLADYVRTVRAPSIVARDGFKDCSIGLLFIDASHVYEDVLADLEAWSGALTDIAVVGFHDVHAEPGVERVLAERVIPSQSSFHDLREVDGLLLAEFRRER
jgi:predicted O-methyltransferase YrrM